jgi:hypothetical protein
VLDASREQVVQKLSEWNWTPVLLSAFPRVCPDGMRPASFYEIDLPRERQAIPQDTRVYGEIAERKKTDAELEGFRRYLDGYTK